MRGDCPRFPQVGKNRPSGQPAAGNRSGPAVSRKPESDRLLGSPLPDVSGQENRGGSTGETSEPTGAEAQYPGAELRCAAELIERDAEQECPEEPAAKADAGIEPDRCSSVPRGGNGEDTRSEIGEVALYDEAGDQGQA